MKRLHVSETIEVPLYRGYLNILISDSLDHVKIELPEFDSEELYAHLEYGNYDGRQGFFVIFNPNSKFRPITHGIIAHEALHAAYLILDMRGISIDYSHDEILAYLTEWVTDRIYESFKRNALLNKIK